MLDTVQKMGNPKGQGIPSRHALHFPEKGGRKFGLKIWEESFRWDLDDVIEFIFPTEYNPVSHKIAVDYLHFLIENGEASTQEKHEFCAKHNYSENTLRKHVMPKLYRFGLIHRTRELPKNTIWKIKSKRKSIEHESMSFSTFLRKIAAEWEALVITGRTRRKHDIQQEKDKEKELDKLERLEWERYQKEAGLD
jgi:hypothetical protein